MRNLSKIDRLIDQLDTALKTNSFGVTQSDLPSPAQALEAVKLSVGESQRVASLMRVNHTGEVCAQGLYQGQAFFAQSDQIAQHMLAAAEEEKDHLVWCEHRLNELGSHTSYLNPVFYALSFGIGALAGAHSNPISLGFVAETEQQVSQHLNLHLNLLPAQDMRSRAIVSQMYSDELRHRDEAIEQGGVVLPAPLKKIMTLMAKVMTSTTSRI